MDAEERYAEEKFSVAVDSLATSAADIRDRIHSAFLSFSPIRATNFEDSELRTRFDSLMADLTAVEAKGSEGRVLATLREMRDEQCEKIAERILEIYDILREKRAIEDYQSDMADELSE